MTSLYSFKTQVVIFKEYTNPQSLSLCTITRLFIWLIIIGPGIGLSPIRRQAITWTNDQSPTHRKVSSRAELFLGKRIMYLHCASSIYARIEQIVEMLPNLLPAHNFAWNFCLNLRKYYTNTVTASAGKISLPNFKPTQIVSIA